MYSPSFTVVLCPHQLMSSAPNQNQLWHALLAGMTLPYCPSSRRHPGRLYQGETHQVRGWGGGWIASFCSTAYHRARGIGWYVVCSIVPASYWCHGLARNIKVAHRTNLSVFCTQALMILSQLSSTIFLAASDRNWIIHFVTILIASSCSKKLLYCWTSVEGGGNVCHLHVNTSDIHSSTKCIWVFITDSSCFKVQT